MRSFSIAALLVFGVLGILLIGMYFYYPFFSINFLGNEKTQPIPNEREQRTEKDFYREKYIWISRKMEAAFSMRASDADSFSVGERTFLEKVAHTVAYPTETQDYEQLCRQGDELIRAGSTNPLVRMWQGEMLFHIKRRAEAEPLLVAAYELENTGYPLIHAFFGLQSLARIAQAKRDHLPDEEKQHIGPALACLSQAILAGEFERHEMHIAYRLLDNVPASALEINKFGFVADWLEHGSAAVDDWLLGILRGNQEVDLAWEARGAGWAKDVSEEGWIGFRQHLEQARLIFTEAWKTHPERPESAALMMRVTRGGHGNPGETVRTWFDRAVSVQMDYPEAYYEMLLNLRPHWGGSHAAMRAFAEECLATGRYDTDVPLFYLYALRNIGTELEDDRWRKVFREKKTRRNFEILFAGLLAEPGRQPARDRILTQQALVSAWSGDYRDAKVLWDRIAHDVDLENGFWGKTLSWSNTPREVVEAELEAFTGIQGDLLSKAETLALNNEINMALSLFEEALNGAGANEAMKAYLLNRIALLRLGKSAEQIGTDAPLYVAARENRIDVAAFMLDKGIDVDGENCRFWTPLQIAAKEGHVEMVKLLLAHGADPNHRGYALRTPLHSAVVSGHADIVRDLIQRGADVNLANSADYAALHFAIYHRHAEIAADLIKSGSDINSQSLGGWSPLHHAVSQQLFDIVYRLIEAGAMVNARTSDGWTPLHLAVSKGNVKLAQLLVTKGAEVDARLPDGRTPLDLCRQNNFMEIQGMLQP